MTRLPPILVILGTLLPIIGSVATGVLAANTRGTYRWLVLIAGPAITWALTDWLAPGVLADGNLLAAVIMLLFYPTVMLYYPVLAVVALVVWLRGRRETGAGRKTK